MVVISRTTASRTTAGNRRGEGRSRLPCTSAPGPPASNRRFSRRTCRTVIRRAAATWAFVSRPPHSAFNSPGRCSSFRLNVKVSIEGGPFHGAVRGGHFHVAAARTGHWLDRASPGRIVWPGDATPRQTRLRLGGGGRPLRHRDGLVGHHLLRLPGDAAPDGGRAGILARRDHRRVLGRPGRRPTGRFARRPLDRPPRPSLAGGGRLGPGPPPR